MSVLKASSGETVVGIYNGGVRIDQFVQHEISSIWSSMRTVT